MIGPPDSQERARDKRRTCDCSDYVERVLVQDVTGSISCAAQRIGSLLPDLTDGVIGNRGNPFVSSGCILLDIAGKVQYLRLRLSYLAALDRVDSVPGREFASWI